MNIAFTLSIVAVIYAVEEHPFTSYPDMLLPVHNVVDNNDCFT